MLEAVTLQRAFTGMILTYYLHGVVNIPVRSEFGLDVHVTK
jgi:hypothetical protein